MLLALRTPSSTGLPSSSAQPPDASTPVNVKIKLVEKETQFNCLQWPVSGQKVDPDVKAEPMSPVPKRPRFNRSLTFASQNVVVDLDSDQEVNEVSKKEGFTESFTQAVASMTYR
eukprot:3272526-Amphidinium_carterae.1